MGRLDGKVAFITGAGSGIARAAAHIFTREGAKVVIAELNPELGRACEQSVRAAGGDATFVETDVTKEDSVKSAIQHTVTRYGKLDVLSIVQVVRWLRTPPHRTSTCGCGITQSLSIYWARSCAAVTAFLRSSRRVEAQSSTCRRR